jgi:hypothetical protein
MQASSDSALAAWRPAAIAMRADPLILLRDEWWSRARIAPVPEQVRAANRVPQAPQAV